MRPATEAKGMTKPGPRELHNDTILEGHAAVPGACRVGVTSTVGMHVGMRHTDQKGIPVGLGSGFRACYAREHCHPTALSNPSPGPCAPHRARSCSPCQCGGTAVSWHCGTAASWPGCSACRNGRVGWVQWMLLYCLLGGGRRSLRRQGERNKRGRSE